MPDSVAKVKVVIAGQRIGYALSQSWVPLPPGITSLPAAPAPVPDATYGEVLTPTALLRPYQESVRVDCVVKVQMTQRRLEYALVLPERTGLMKVRALGMQSQFLGIFSTELITRAKAALVGRNLRLAPVAMALRPTAALVDRYLTYGFVPRVEYDTDRYVSGVPASFVTRIKIDATQTIGVTYNPLFEAVRSGYTIGGDGKTATRSADGQSTIVLQNTKDSGKWYVEVVLTGSLTPAAAIFGFATAGNDTQYIGNYAVSFGGNQSSTFQNGVTGLSALNIGTVTNGMVVSLALDVDAKKAWIGRNNGYPSGGNPAAGTNPTYTWTSTHSFTAAFRPFYASVLTLPATPLYLPSGFVGW